MKTCPKCSEQIKDTLKFCIYCGCNIAQEEAKNKAKFCGECGAEILKGMKFCGECGAKVSAPAQNDDVWAQVLDEQQPDDPWAVFADSKQTTDFQKGVAFFEKQDYTLALPLLLPVAEQGDKDAQFKVGCCYDCVKQYDKAMDWYLLAAQQDCAFAMNNIGEMYFKAHGVKEDCKKASEWFKKSADKNNPLGCQNLAFLFENGYGVQMDEKKAFDYYLKAAQLGNAKAQHEVAQMYFLGVGTQKDFGKSADWYRHALDGGNKNSAKGLYNVAKRFLYGEYNSNDCIDKQKGFHLMTILADYGDKSAWYELGCCYHRGIGTDKDDNKAKEWLKKAMDAGEYQAIDLYYKIENDLLW